MKRTIHTLFYLSIFFLLVGCAPTAAPTTRSQTTLAAEDLETIAKTVIEQLGKGDYAAAYTRFDSNLRSKLPEPKLKDTWEQITAQVGALQEQVGVRTTEQQGRQIVTVTCRFEKDLLDVRLGFDEQSQVTGLFFSQSQAAASTQAAYSPPEYANSGSFHEVDITIGGGEWALPGTMTLPYCGNEPIPAVVLLHGSGPNDRNETIGPNQPFHDLAWGLASHCIAVLRYDKRTLAHASQLTPQVLTTFTTEQEIVEDALLAVQLLRQTPGIDPKKIYLLGHSEGGMLAPRIAQRDPDLAGLVLLAAPTRPLEVLALDQLTYLFQLDGSVTDQEQADLEAVKQDIVRIQGPDLPANLSPQEYPLGISPAYWLDLRGYQPAEIAKTLSIPLLVVQGQRDYQILASKDFAGWKAALEGKGNATLKLYPRLNHLLMPGEGPSTPEEYQVMGHVSAEVITDIVDWVGPEDLSSQVPVQKGITLKVRRWFGLNLGSQVRSLLKLSIAGPENIQSVSFLIDGKTFDTVRGSPFQSSFHTDDYTPGWHEISAIARTAEGTVLLSQTVRNQFLSAAEANRILYPIIGAVIFLALGMWLFQFGIFSRRKRESVPLGSARRYGAAGGSICPKCGRPFSFHILAPEILAGKFDTCSNCGRVGLFRRIPLEELRKAEADEVEAAKPESLIHPVDAEMKLRRQLDESKFDDPR